MTSAPVRASTSPLPPIVPPPPSEEEAQLPPFTPHALAYYTLVTSVSVMSSVLAARPVPVTAAASGPAAAFDGEALRSALHSGRGAAGPSEAWDALSSAGYFLDEASSASSSGSAGSVTAASDAFVAATQAIDDAALGRRAPSLGAYAPAPLRVNGAERIALSADVWLTQEGEPRDTVVQRATALTPRWSALPFNASAYSYSGDGLASATWPLELNAMLEAEAQASWRSGNSAARPLQPVGIAVTMSTLTWKLVGTPLWAAHGLDSASYASLQAASRLPDGSDGLLHVVQLFTSNTSLLTLEPGTLRPGYVYYAAIADGALSAAWALDASFLLAPLGAPTPLGGASPDPSRSFHDVLYPLPSRYWRTGGPVALVTRMPPAGGALSASPLTGKALSDDFTFTAGGWATDGPLYARTGTLTHAGMGGGSDSVTAVASAALAALLPTALPLSAHQQSLAALAVLSQSIPWPAPALAALARAALLGAGPSTLPGLAGSLIPSVVCAAPAPSSEAVVALPPAWWYRLALAASVLTDDGTGSAGSSRRAAVRQATSAMCAGLVSSAAGALRSAASYPATVTLGTQLPSGVLAPLLVGAPTSSIEGPLRVHLRVLDQANPASVALLAAARASASGSAPIPAQAGAVAALHALLGSPLTWPGAPLVPALSVAPAASTSAVTRMAPVSAAGALDLPSSVSILAVVIDAEGMVVAVPLPSALTLRPFLEGVALTNRVAVAASVKDAAMALFRLSAGNPHLGVLSVAQLAAALNGTAPRVDTPGSTAACSAVTDLLSVTLASLIAAASSSGAALEDGTVAALTMSLSALTSSRDGACGSNAAYLGSYLGEVLDLAVPKPAGSTAVPISGGALPALPAGAAQAAFNSMLALLGFNDDDQMAAARKLQTSDGTGNSGTRFDAPETVRALLPKLAAAVLRSGEATVALTAGPAAAFDSGRGPFCGAAMSAVFARATSDTPGFTLALPRPLMPCVDAATVNARPPTFSITRALTSAVAGGSAAPGNVLHAFVVQWSTSQPGKLSSSGRNASAGWKSGDYSLTSGIYGSPGSVAYAAAAQSCRTVMFPPPSPNASRAGSVAFIPADASAAYSATLRALLEARENATVAHGTGSVDCLTLIDGLADSDIHSGVTTFGLVLAEPRAGSSSPQAPTMASSVPLAFTIPVPNASLVEPSALAQTGAFNLPLAPVPVHVRCPAVVRRADGGWEPDSHEDPAAYSAAIVAQQVPLGPPVGMAFAARLSATVLTTMTLPYETEITGRPTSTLPGLDWGSKGGFSYEGSGPWADKGASWPQRYANRSAPVFVMEIDCEPLEHVQSLRVVCGPGTYGQRVLAACPAPIFTPLCARLTSEGWDPAGCTATRTSSDAGIVSCVCNINVTTAGSILTSADVAIKWAALSRSSEVIAAEMVPFIGSQDFEASAGMYAVVSTIVVTLLVAAVGALWLDAAQFKRFATALGDDPEVAFLGRIQSLLGRTFYIDRLAEEVSRKRAALTADEEADGAAGSYSARDSAQAGPAATPRTARSTLDTSRATHPGFALTRATTSSAGDPDAEEAGSVGLGAQSTSGSAAWQPQRRASLGSLRRPQGFGVPSRDQFSPLRATGLAPATPAPNPLARFAATGTVGASAVRRSPVLAGTPSAAAAAAAVGAMRGRQNGTPISATKISMGDGGHDYAPTGADKRDEGLANPLRFITGIGSTGTVLASRSPGDSTGDGAWASATNPLAKLAHGRAASAGPAVGGGGGTAYSPGGVGRLAYIPACSARWSIDHAVGTLEAVVLAENEVLAKASGNGLPADPYSAAAYLLAVRRHEGLRVSADSPLIRDLLECLPAETRAQLLSHGSGSGGASRSPARGASPLRAANHALATLTASIAGKSLHGGSHASDGGSVASSPDKGGKRQPYAVGVDRSRLRRIAAVFAAHGGRSRSEVAVRPGAPTSAPGAAVNVPLILRPAAPVAAPGSDQDVPAIDSILPKGVSSMQRKRMAWAATAASHVASAIARAGGSVGTGSIPGPLSRGFLLCGLVLRTGCLRGCARHTLLSPFIQFDPLLSRGARMLRLLTVMALHLFCTVFWYGYAYGGDLDSAAFIREGPGFSWSSLLRNASQTMDVAAWTAFCLLPVTFFGLRWAFSVAGEAQFRWRYPYIAEEMRRRRDFEVRLASVPLPRLLAEIDDEPLMAKGIIAGPGDDPSGGTHSTPAWERLFDSLPSAPTAAIPGASAAAPAEAGARRTLIGAIPGGAAFRSTRLWHPAPHPSVGVDVEAAAYGWIDAPRALQVCCPRSVLAAFGRAGPQKAGFVHRTRSVLDAEEATSRGVRARRRGAMQAAMRRRYEVTLDSVTQGSLTSARQGYASTRGLLPVAPGVRNPVPGVGMDLDVDRLALTARRAEPHGGEGAQPPSPGGYAGRAYGASGGASLLGGLAGETGSTAATVGPTYSEGPGGLLGALMPALGHLTAPPTSADVDSAEVEFLYGSGTGTKTEAGLVRGALVEMAVWHEGGEGGSETEVVDGDQYRAADEQHAESDAEDGMQASGCGRVASRACMAATPAWRSLRHALKLRAPWPSSLASMGVDLESRELDGRVAAALQSLARRRTLGWPVYESYANEYGTTSDATAPAVFCVCGAVNVRRRGRRAGDKLFSFLPHLVVLSSSWSLYAIAAYALLGALTLFCGAYSLAWGVYYPWQLVLPALNCFAVSLVVSWAILEPSVAMLEVVWAMMLWPTLAPWVAWMPVIGPSCAGRRALSAAGASSAALSGRLRYLTLSRAAAYAGGLDVDTSLLLHTPPGDLASLIGATDGAPLVGSAPPTTNKPAMQQQQQSRRSRHGQQQQQLEEEGVPASSSASAGTRATTRQVLLDPLLRAQLVVRRYALAQATAVHTALRQLHSLPDVSPRSLWAQASLRRAASAHSVGSGGDREHVVVVNPVGTWSEWATKQGAAGLAREAALPAMARALPVQAQDPELRQVSTAESTRHESREEQLEREQFEWALAQNDVETRLQRQAAPAAAGPARSLRLGFSSLGE